jgi:hypothetical protein
VASSLSKSIFATMAEPYSCARVALDERWGGATECRPAMSRAVRKSQQGPAGSCLPTRPWPPQTRFRFASLAIVESEFRGVAGVRTFTALTISLCISSCKPISLAFLTVPWPILSAVCRLQFTRVENRILLSILGGSNSINSLESLGKVAFIGETDARDDLLDT